MSKEGENEIKALERATEIQRLFHKSEEMKRQYLAAPTGVKAAKLMGEALKIDALIQELADETHSVDLRSERQGTSNLKPVAEAIYRKSEIAENKSGATPKHATESSLQSMSSHQDWNDSGNVKGRFINVASGLLKPFASHDEEESLIKKELPPFEKWIIRHLDQRRKVAAGHGTDFDADPKCSLGRWIRRHRCEALDELAEKHEAFHQAVRERLDTGTTDTNLARTCNALLIALSKSKTSYSPD